MKDLISVIVLLNDVESYISLSLESILKQTYKNLEILLVDKNSKDNTMKICEYYASKDRRIKFVHVDGRTTKNKKNVGIERANGKYVTFIHAGDRVSTDYIEYMHKYMKEEKADIVSVNTYNYHERKSYKDIFKVYESNDILTGYFHMDLTTHCCGKLYKKSLFKDITYAENVYYDDFMTTYKLFDKAKKVVNIKVDKYCIVTRKDKNNKITDKERMKKMEACFGLLSFIEDKYPKLVDSCKIKICYEAIELFKNTEDKEYKRQLYSYIKLYRKYALKDRRFDFKKKTLCIRTLLGYNFTRLSFFLEKSI